LSVTADIFDPVGIGSYDFTGNFTGSATSFLTIGGPIVAPKGTSYFGTVTVSAVPVSAVPEPGTYALMLAGLGVMGVVARRRKSASV
jgi:hypothetical protein